MFGKFQFVEGIYNYCDRWCERCDKTAVCRVFYDEQKSLRRRKRRGEDGDGIEADLKDVSRSFRKVGRLLARYAKTHNLDLDEIKRNAALTDPHPHEDQIENHPLVREADEYSKRIPPLLEQLEPAYDDERDETADRAAYMNVKRDVNTLKSIHDACEVLAWDWPLVRVKTRRVMNSWFEAADEAEEDYRKIHRHDAEMTADLIRRCLQRDKLALLSIYEWDEQFQDTAIELLARAEKLLRGIILYNGKP
ncbi:MAG: hypothetical protein JXA11_07680 [Phycisphaerae bacterium]|nr:hypothetical protein [Phycisphaerae bacterium]